MAAEPTRPFGPKTFTEEMFDLMEEAKRLRIKRGLVIEMGGRKDISKEEYFARWEEVQTELKKVRAAEAVVSRLWIAQVRATDAREAVENVGAVA